MSTGGELHEAAFSAFPSEVSLWNMLAVGSTQDDHYDEDVNGNKDDTAARHVLPAVLPLDLGTLTGKVGGR